jgi:hypothetical protein
VTVGVSSVVLTGVVQFMALQTRKLAGHSYRLEMQHALRSTLDAISRDLRLAGAGLPTDGQFVALTGTEAAGGDTITARTCIVGADLSCVPATLQTAPNTPSGSTTLQLGVGETTAFSPGSYAYVRETAGGGQFVTVSSVDAGNNRVTITPGLTQDYRQGSGFYAIDERRYAIDRSNPANPVLTLSVNGGAAQAFAAGINDLQIQYVLQRNCPACDVVNAPAANDTATWRLVNEVILSATAQTVGTVRAEDVTSITASSRTKPRNLLP